MATVKDVESQPLMEKAPPGGKPVPGVPAAEPPQRGWNGHLLACCGDCDSLGVSTCAYVKWLAPVAFGHNIKRAMNASFWKHAILITLLFGAWSWLYIGAAFNVGVACGPAGPHGPHGHHHVRSDWPLGPQPKGPLFEQHGEPLFAAATELQPLQTAAAPLTVQFSPQVAQAAAQAQQAAEKAAGDVATLAQQAGQEATTYYDTLTKKMAFAAAAAQEQGKRVAAQAQAAAAPAVAQEQALAAQIDSQIQQAKQEVADALAGVNLQLGRKLLHGHKDHDHKEHNDKDHEGHKHEHDHEEHHDKDHEGHKHEHDHEEHEHEEEEAKRLEKEAKRAAKEAAKEAKRAAKEAKHALKEAGVWAGPQPLAEREWGAEWDVDFENASPECLAAQRSLLAVWGMAVLSALVGVVYAARMRSAIRERFGIPGSRLRDFWAWCCCAPCALCQETRTLAANNVHGGTWFGPTVLTAPSAHPLAVPQPQPAPVKA